MSEYARIDSDYEDKTQPSAEILAALQGLANSQQHLQLLPQESESEYDRLSKQLREDPMQLDIWPKVVAIAEAEADIARIEATYEALLEHFPDTASAQIAYLSHYMAPDVFKSQCQQLFNRFLRTNPPPQSIDLWRYYLDTVRRSNPDSAQRDAIQQCFDFTISKIGHDINAGSIWHDYVQFLKEAKTSSDWEEQRKRDALRKVYHRAVQIPLDNVEKLWQELETFEMSMNKITAKKFMADLSPAHMQARTVLRQQQKYLAPLNLAPSALPPSSPPALHLPPLRTFTSHDRTLVGAWRAYLKWEESNPLELEEKDRPLLLARVQGAYKKALGRMRFYSEIWYMAYTWTSTHGKPDDAKKLLEEGLKANPKSPVLTFALADVFELRKEYAEVRALYERLLDLLRIELEELEQYIKPGGNSQQDSDTNESQQSISTQPDTSQNPTMTKEKEFKEKRSEYGLVWIMFMRFSRRAEGIPASRLLFANARKQRLTPWNVYELGALMEYHGSIDGDTNNQLQVTRMGVATRIFERGMEVFGNDPDYISRYLTFLISVNDEKNARALFERVIGTFSPDQARPIWEKWARYEYMYGDIEASLKLEQRMADVYPNDPPIKRFAQRHTLPGIDVIASRDLGWLARQSSSQSSSQFSQNGNGSSSILASSTNHLSSNNKRAGSPDQPRVKREAADHGPSHTSNKRARPSSPPRERERERERDRDRERDRWDHGAARRRSPPPRRHEREDEKPVVLPPVLYSFIGQLPEHQSFDGPIFRTEDLMNLFRSAVIPASSTPSRTRSPQPPARTTRPPPDYGPYQGPGGGRGRRY